ncbi:DUF3078 domain-containing protein [Candidatus Poribacteria bacterium]|nr:DUF3078 domain-containing protein [Candidatus Poribacteria bacterium]
MFLIKKTQFIFFISVLMCFTYSLAFGQEGEEAAPPKTLHHSIVAGLSLSQVAFQDWAKGGENSVAWTTTLDGKSTYDPEKINWANTYKFAFGQTKLGSDDFRKTDDNIDLESVFTYKTGFYINPYAAATLKTQFLKGYEYDDEGEKTAVSKFFDPAYLTQSAGVGYEPIKQVKTRLGAAVREIITGEFNSYSDDPETEDIEEIRFDAGFESVTEGEWNLRQNVILKSKLEIFVALTEPRDAAIRSDSTLAIKVSKNVNVNLNVLIVKDETLSEKTQIKESLAVGFSYIFVE